MLLWELIRDFFVSNVFGGTLSNGQMYDPSIGYGAIWRGDAGSQEFFFNETFGVPIGIIYNSGADVAGPAYLCIGDWLSTTATIITLVALFIGISCLMVSLFRWIVRLVSLRG